MNLKNTDYTVITFKSDDIQGMESGGFITTTSIAKGNMLRVGFSFCSPRDTFIEERAKAKSLGRLIGRLSRAEGKAARYCPSAIVLVLEKNESAELAIEAVLQDIASGDRFKIHRRGRHGRDHAAHITADGQIEGIFDVLGQINLPAWCCPRVLRAPAWDFTFDIDDPIPKVNTPGEDIIERYDDVVVLETLSNIVKEAQPVPNAE